MNNKMFERRRKESFTEYLITFCVWIQFSCIRRSNRLSRWKNI